MKATFCKYLLDFKRPGGTSRGVLTQKETWFLLLQEEGRTGIGECGLFRGLSRDDVPEYGARLQWLCDHITEDRSYLMSQLTHFPSIRFGLEQALLSLGSGDPFELFPSVFTEGKASIAINGLIWMGDKRYMQEQIKNRLAEGFACIKLKIGALDFETELELLAGIRKDFSRAEVELRVDANGAFTPQNAPEKLKRLSEYDLHSIEQPIAPGNRDALTELCRTSPVPVALDEELIVLDGSVQKEKFLRQIQPQYLVLKPSLLGGYHTSEEWIKAAESIEAGWWVTSALESNIGLNAIAQWTYLLQNPVPQGLGTGSLFTNNIDSPLTVSSGCLSYNPDKNWSKQIINSLCT